MPYPSTLVAIAALVTATPTQAQAIDDRVELERPIVRIPLVAGGEFEVRIDDTGPYRFAYDPGLTGDGWLDTSLASRLGLLPRPRRGVPPPRSVRADIDMDGARVRGLQLELSDPGPGTVRGTLGQRALRGVVASTDSASRWLQLHRGDSGATTAEVALRFAGAGRASFAVPTAIVGVRRSSSGHLLARAHINDRDAGWFVFDTGASRTAISNEVAERLDLKSVGGSRLLTPTRTHRSTLWRASRVRVGSVEVNFVDLDGLDLRDMSRELGGAVGVIGGDILGHCVVEFDTLYGTLVIHDPRHYRLDGVAWQPLTLLRRLPITQVNYEGHDGDFLIDSGDCSTVTIFQPAVEAQDLLRERTVAVEKHAEIGGEFELLAGKLSSLLVGAEQFREVPALFAANTSGVLASDLATGNLGTTALRPFVTIIDYPRRRVAFLSRDLVPLTELQIEELTGSYRDASGGRAEVRRAGDRLTAQVNGDAKVYQLVPQDEDRFYSRFDGGWFTFERDPRGTIRQLVWQRDQRAPRRLRKVEDVH